MAKGLKQGFFKPKFSDKYKGDINNIVYRSSWEFEVMCMLDKNSNVLEWSSEEYVIPYRCVTDGRMHRYFIDFFAKVKQKDGNIKSIIIEVKPKSQTIAPVQKTKKPSKTYLNEVLTFAKNQSKWEAAREYCRKKGYDFIILTEDQIFRKK